MLNNYVDLKGLIMLKKTLYLQASIITFSRLLYCVHVRALFKSLLVARLRALFKLIPL
jgi:hypothetical protein